MANSRSTSKLVWIPYNKENVAFDAFYISVTRDSIHAHSVRGGEKAIRKYESFAALCDDLHIRNLAD